MNKKRKIKIALFCTVSLIIGSIFNITGFNLNAYGGWGGYIVTYDANGGENPPSDYDGYIPGDNIIIKDKEGMTNGAKTFVGWTLTSDNSGRVYNPGEQYPVAYSDITFYAKWELPLPENTISISKTADKDKAKRNEEIKYTVTLKNIAGQVLNGVKIEDSLPVTLVQKSSNASTVITGKSANIGSMNPDEIITFEYTYTVPMTAVAGSKIKNTAKAIDSKNKEYIANKEVEVIADPPKPLVIIPIPPKDDETNKDEEETLLDKMKKHKHFAYMTGYPDMTFKPNGNITRDEVTAIFARLLTGKMEIAEKYNPAFSDIKGDKWSKDYIGYMKQKNIIKGYADGTFRPDNPITRGEFAAIASRFNNLSDGTDIKFSDVDESYWAAGYIKSVAKKGWIKGYADGSFRPETFTKRAEVVSLTNRMLDRIADKKYVDEHNKELKYYRDVDKTYWAYYDIHEASNGHDYKRDEKGGEIWLRIWDLFIPNP